MKGILPRSFFKRPLDTSKGDYGHVLVVGGSIGLTGAPVMAAQAALRAGAGIVTLAVPEAIYFIAASKLTEVMVHPMPETAQGSLSPAAIASLQPFLLKADCLALGPGLSRNPATGRAVQQLVAKTDLPVVLDADGINAFAGAARKKLKSAKGPIVMTPHPGEMARLLGISIAEVEKKRRETALGVSRETNVIVVLKGHRTIVADPKGKLYENKTGNPGMASAGMGDVLTGVIAALIGKGFDPFTAAKAGVYLHGLAGDIAARKVGQVSLMASDLLAAIPDAFRHASRR